MKRTLDDVLDSVLAAALGAAMVAGPAVLVVATLDIIAILVAVFLVPLGVYILLWAASNWRAAVRRVTPLVCAACGYDLRASPGPSCPECGAPVTA